MTRVTELAKITGERWRKLTDKEKKPYEEKAQADKARYEKAMKDYKQ